MTITNGVPGTMDTGNSYSDEQLQELAKRSDNKARDEQIISWTKHAYFRCRTIRQQIERQWYVNLAFYTGRQNVAAIPMSTGASINSGMRLWVPPAPYYRSRPVFNRIRPAVRTELAKLTAQKPSATVVPATSDEKDLVASRAAEQIWESVYNRKKLKAAHRQAQLWTLNCGVGFIKCFWNPDAVDPDNPDIPGDFCYDVVTPFHIFVPDMLAVDIEDQPYVLHVTTRTPEWVQINYPEVPATPNVMEASDIMSNAFLNLVGAAAYKKDAVLIYEVWVKPGNLKFMPNGGMFTIVGDTVVECIDTGNPYLHNQYPFAKLEHIPNNRFYADSGVTDLIAVQREYNRTRGQIIENKNATAHTQLLAAEGSVDANKITTEPGQVIFFKLGFPEPKPMPIQGLPPYIIQELNMQLADFEDISGQHNVSKGQAPPGVTAATAISFLQEQDDTMLSPTFASIEEFYEKLGFQTLSLVKQYWDVKRTVKVAGSNNSFNALTFMGSNITSTDIRVEAGSSLPTSKSAKQALLMDLMQMGFIPPEKGLQLMDVGGVQQLYEELQVDTAQADRENMKMAAVTDDLMNQYLQTFIPQPNPMDPLSALMGGQPDPTMPNTGQAPPDPTMPQDPTMQDPSMQDPTQIQGPGPAAPQSPLVDPATGQPLVDANGNPTAPPLIVPVNSFDNHMAHIATHNNYRKSQEYEQLDPSIKKLFEEHVNQHMAALSIPPGSPDPTSNTSPMMQPPPGSSGPPPGAGPSPVDNGGGMPPGMPPMPGQGPPNPGQPSPMGA